MTDHKGIEKEVTPRKYAHVKKMLELLGETLEEVNSNRRAPIENLKELWKMNKKLNDEMGGF